MTRQRRLVHSSAIALAFCFALAWLQSAASAAPVVAGVTLPTGSFSTTLSGSGNAILTGASGTYQNHTGDILGKHIYVPLGVSAGAQSPALSMPNVAVSNTVASGSANLTYDDVAPGTSLSLNSLAADLNGAGGSNQNTNFTITAGALNVTVASLFTVPLLLTVNGTITNATFTSTGGVPANPAYDIPGNLDLTIQGTVTGFIDLPNPVPDLNLGVIFTLTPSVISVPTSLPGSVLLTDLSGGLGPYPADMGVNLSSPAFPSVAVPLVLPISMSQSYTLSGHNSGFSQLTINNGSQISANITLGSPTYSLSGSVPLALVPEPGSIGLASLALVGLVGLVWRRKRRT